MARMIPSTVSSDTKSEAEKRVFDILKTSLDILGKNVEGNLFDGEIDFLILSEQDGILVLEVKGGAIKHDGTEGCWYQNGELLKESLYGQAKKNKYQIIDYLKRKCRWKNLQFPVGHAVSFPDVYSELTLLPPEADSLITITGGELRFVEKAIKSIMEKYRSKNSKLISKSDFDKIKKHLMPVFEYGRSLVDKIGAVEERIFRLTSEQCNVLDLLNDRKRVRIEGYAGTGKTVLAIKKAEELASSGKSVLMLCYNKLLAKRIKDSLHNESGNISANNYHNFCIQVLKEGGITVVTDDKKEEFWKNELPERFLKYIKNNPIKYDAIIVDEGQDFMTDYWITIEEMLKDESYFYIFYDPRQNIFNSDLEFPIEDTPFALKVNCRNSRNIGDELKKITGTDMKIRDGIHDGIPVQIESCSCDEDMLKKLKIILHNLVNEGGLSPDDIAIIGGHSLEHTCLEGNRKLGNFTIVDGGRQEEGKASMPVRYYTHMRYKGLESRAAILLDVDSSDERWSDNALYTAMSRARVVLNVLRRDK